MFQESLDKKFIHGSLNCFLNRIPNINSISSKSSHPYNNSKLEYPDTDDLDVRKAHYTKDSSKSQFSLSSTKVLSFFSISLFLFSTSPLKAG